MTKPVAIGFRVHVQPDLSVTEKAASKAGFILPEDHKKSERNAVDSGVVLDIGPTAWAAYNSEPWVKVGDKVVYARHAGYRVDDIVVLNDEDIVTKLED